MKILDKPTGTNIEAINHTPESISQLQDVFRCYAQCNRYCLRTMMIDVWHKDARKTRKLCQLTIY